MVNRYTGAALTVGIENAGAFRIDGTTKNVGTPANTPVGRRVRLHDQPSGLAIREVWSDPVTGAYAFRRLREGSFYVVSFDHTGQYGGVIETDLLPEPGP